VPAPSAAAAAPPAAAMAAATAAGVGLAQAGSSGGVVTGLPVHPMAALSLAEGAVLGVDASRVSCDAARVDLYRGTALGAPAAAGGAAAAAAQRGGGDGGELAGQPASLTAPAAVARGSQQL
jgi:hypothetical protein